MADIKLRDITKRYADGTEAVKHMNLEIEDGEFMILVGPSGCGKSTALRMIAGLEDISEGELLIGDRVVNNLSPRDRDIAMVFQNYALYPHMTVGENMGFALKLAGTAPEEIDRKVQEAARILGAAERVSDDLGQVRWAAEQAAVERLREQLAGQLGARELTETIAEGREMSTENALGWLRRARGSRKRPAGGWESLTPTELQVVELAAAGMTNPEIAERMFIARGTVKIHLSHVYSKLDVRNRAELAALVSRRAPT